MKILPEILKIEGIKSEKDFFIFLEKEPNNKTLHIINTTNNSGIFGENEPEKNITICNSVINLEEISFSNFSKLRLNNCIFTGKVTLFHKKSILSENIEIEIENCIFMKEVFCNNIRRIESLKIAVYNSNFAYLAFTDIVADEIILNHSKVFMLYLDNLNLDILEVENNKIEFLDVKEYNCKKIIFDFKQINPYFIKNRMKKKFFNLEFKEFEKLDFNINLFEFIKFYSGEDLRQRVHSGSLESLIKFVKKETNITKDKKKLNELMFWETFFSQKSVPSRLFLWITKAFFYPGRFLIFGGIIFILFSIIYVIPVMQFGISGENIRNLNLKEALYFSGVTFTTLGFGDISPIGISRIFAIVEAFLGIITMNTFMVALIKKYID